LARAPFTRHLDCAAYWKHHGTNSR
jgi:hypothetical protein